MPPDTFHDVPADFIVGAPLTNAVANVRHFLQQQGYFPSDATCVGVAVASLAGFALGGGLDDEPLANLREIISRAEPAD